MSHNAPIHLPSNLGTHSDKPSCTPDCILATHDDHRGRTGRYVTVGDIRTTQTPLLAAFYTFLDGYSQTRTSTHISQSLALSSTHRRSIPTASRDSSTCGSRTRPCIVTAVTPGVAQVFLMGTFEGATIDKLNPYLREYVAVLFSRTSPFNSDLLEESNTAHFHSSPEWTQEKQFTQYIIPLIQDIDINAVCGRWWIRRTAGGDSSYSGDTTQGEGYRMNAENLFELRTHSNDALRDLKQRCNDRKYRAELRHALDDRPKPVSGTKSRTRSTHSVSSAARRPSIASSTLSGISESDTASSVTETIASRGERPSDSKSWRSELSSPDSYRSRQPPTKSDSPQAPKAARRNSKTPSLRSLLARPFRPSVQPAVASMVQANDRGTVSRILS
uniref:Uncharacterized protein n=1 Tax=Schizophyllum commune (strain H4-8 / FGSC 9210) TaxID=578458 RepID=D8PVN1_SCHCM